MPKAKKAPTKAAPKPYAAAAPANPLIEKRTKNFGVGQDIQPNRDLSRYVKWPRYVRLQRQRRVLHKRLRVPPSVNAFTRTLDKTAAANVFKFLLKYRPETHKEKKGRLTAEATAKEAGQSVEKTKPYVLKFGLNHVTGLIEQKKAQLVLIAHDVDPIELVLWLPALCRKMDVPFAIVKNKARLGYLVHQKNATAVAITRVRPEDKQAFGKVIESINDGFVAEFDTHRRHWGGGQMGLKSVARMERRRKAVEKEAAAKAQA